MAVTFVERFLVGKHFPARLRKVTGLSRLTSRKAIQAAMAKIHTRTVVAQAFVREWVVSDKESVSDFLDEAVEQVGRWGFGKRHLLGNLALLESPSLLSLRAVQDMDMFKVVLFAVPYTRWLPLAQMTEVWAAPNRRELLIGGVVDLSSQILTVYRGDFSRVTVPLSIFKPSGDGTKPRFKEFGILEYGHGVRFGNYESSAEVILYEGDPSYRKALKESRRAQERTLGASIRRLRMQRGVLQKDFHPLTARTIARIESNEVEMPHGKTLSKIAKRLGVEPDEIITY
jgi:hypothetical protein